MSNKKRRSKQFDFVIFIGIVMFFLLIGMPFLYAGKVEAAANSDDLSSLYTSTESVLGITYEELIESLDQDTFKDYLSTLEINDSYVIPGISQTNIANERTCDVMTPQGVCIAEEYLIISAYDKSRAVSKDIDYATEPKQSSVLYIMDVESGEYLTTISLNTKCHVGALAYNPDDELIYIADSTRGKVQKLSLEKIVSCVESGNDTESDILKFDAGAIDTQGYTPSFLAYYKEHLYVGQFAKCNLEDLFSSRMAVFTRDGKLLERDEIQLPYYSQGVTFAEWDNEIYMLVSSSFGRDKTAKMHVYVMDEEQDGTLQRKKKVGNILCPNMSEDIDIQGDCIYTCYESASNFYRLAMDDNGESTNVVDRIMVSSLGKTLATLLDEDFDEYAGAYIRNHIVRIMKVPERYWERKGFNVHIDLRRRLFLRLF